MVIPPEVFLVDNTPKELPHFLWIVTFFVHNLGANFSKVGTYFSYKQNDISSEISSDVWYFPRGTPPKRRPKGKMIDLTDISRVKRLKDSDFEVIIRQNSRLFYEMSLSLYII